MIRHALTTLTSENVFRDPFPVHLSPKHKTHYVFYVFYVGWLGLITIKPDRKRGVFRGYLILRSFLTGNYHGE